MRLSLSICPKIGYFACLGCFDWFFHRNSTLELRVLYQNRLREKHPLLHILSMVSLAIHNASDRIVVVMICSD
jgi:hypothetical protein